MLEINSNELPGFYSYLFIMEKITGGWRPVIDIEPLNSFHLMRYKLETVASVLSYIRKDDFVDFLNLGCILPGPHPFRVEGVPLLCPGRSSVPIQGSVFQLPNCSCRCFIVVLSVP